MHHIRVFAGLLALAVLAMSSGCGGDGLTRVPIQGELTCQGAPVPARSFNSLRRQVLQAKVPLVNRMHRASLP